MDANVAEFSNGFVVPTSLYIKMVVFLIVAFVGTYYGLWFLKNRKFDKAPKKQIVRESIEPVGQGVFVMVVTVEGNRFAVFKSRDNLSVKPLPNITSSNAPSVDE